MLLERARGRKISISPSRPEIKEETSTSCLGRMNGAGTNPLAGRGGPMIDYVRGVKDSRGLP